MDDKKIEEFVNNSDNFTPANEDVIFEIQVLRFSIQAAIKVFFNEEQVKQYDLEITRLINKATNR